MSINGYDTQNKVVGYGSTRRQLRSPASQIGQQHESRYRPPPEQLVRKPGKEILIEQQEREFDSPQCSPEQDDDSELHLEKQPCLLYQVRRGDLAWSHWLPDFEHSGRDDLIHGPHADKNRKRKVHAAIVSIETSMDAYTYCSPSDGECNGDSDR